VAPDDIIYSSFDTLLGGALSLWELGQKRKPGAPKVRLFNPTAEANGWALEHTVIEIVNDDMPFLVDSVSAELIRRERNIHLLMHPMARVRRDEAGNRIELTSTQSAPLDAIHESYMHIEIDEETQPAELETLRAAIEEVLGQVRLSVADWRTMRERLASDIAELDAAKLPMPAEEVDEARQFLQWLDSGNFIFLGYRRYGFETREGKDYLPPRPDSGLGILREVRSESRERGTAPLTQEFSEYARKKDLLIVTKANNRSQVHRAVPMDRIGIKRYDASGNLIGEDRFLGLFTTAAYIRSVNDIPMLRLKTRRVIERVGVDPRSHNGKALADILENFPRDEFLQITDEDLYEIALGILQLQERQRVALFLRKDVFSRFVSCYVFVPRDRYTPDFKEKAKQILEEALEGRDTAVYDHVTDSPLARGLFVVRTSPGRIPEIDVKRVEAYLAEAARTWSDRLLDQLCAIEGEEEGIELHRRYKRAFPLAYSERFSAAAALHDIKHIESVLATGKLVVDLYRHRADQSDHKQFHLKIIHTGPAVPLSEIMPRLENMGLRVLAEVPYEVQPLGATEPVRIRDFGLSGHGMQDDLSTVKAKFQEAFIRVWNGDAQNDGFNRLVLGAELEWHEVVILRSYAKYVRQIGINLSQELGQPGHRPPAAAALPAALRSAVRTGREDERPPVRGHEHPGADRRRAQCRHEPGRRPRPAALRHPHRSDIAHELLPVGVGSGLSAQAVPLVQARLPEDQGAAAAAAAVRDFRLLAGDGRDPPPGRQGRPRRDPLVRPARGFPDGDPRPDESAEREECRHRADGLEGRLRSEEPVQRPGHVPA
jgi:glutamate dehydrogenase